MVKGDGGGPTVQVKTGSGDVRVTDCDQVSGISYYVNHE
jgi:hypothetical protein